MAFGKKLQDVFDRYVAAILKKGADNFDFYKMAPALDRGLAKDGLKIKSPQFFAEVFDELENPRSNWKIVYDDLKVFLSILPKEWIKRKITPEILVKWIPKEDWELYGRKPSTASLKRVVRASYIKELKDKDEYNVVAISHEIEDGWNVQVFLGDFSHVVSSRSTQHYDYAYDALEQEMGKVPLETALRREFGKEEYTIKAWPNLANITSASYEVEVLTKNPAWMVERRVTKAIGRIVPT